MNTQNKKTTYSKTVSGISWVAVARLCTSLLDMATQILLARLLFPTDFGTVGIAMSIQGIFIVITDFGMNAAIIQRQDIDQDDLSTAFWLNIIISVFLVFLVIIFAPTIANFYSKPNLGSILSYLSTILIISAFSSIQRAQLTKKMDFKELAKVDICGTIAYGVAAITMSISGFGIWALVAGTIASRVVSTVMLWVINPWWPKICFKKASFQKLFAFGSWILGTQIVGNLSSQVDVLTAGKLLDATSVGNYTYSFRITDLFVTKINQILSVVLFPALSEIQNDFEKIRSMYLKATRILALINVPINIGLLVVAPTFVPVVLGDKWIAAIPIMQWLCINALMNGVGGSLWGAVLRATGKASVLFNLTALRVFALAAFVFAGSKWGAVGIAAAVAIYAVVFRFIYQAIVNRAIKMRMMDYIKSTMGGFVSSIALILSVYIVQKLIENSNIPLWGSLIIQILVGAAAYLLCILILFRSHVDEFLDVIKQIPFVKSARKLFSNLEIFNNK